MTVEDLALTSDGMRVHLPFSKHDPLGRGADVDLAITAEAALCPVRATRLWLERVGCSSGPLFRPVRGTCIAGVGIRPRVVSRLVDRLTQIAAIGGRYSAHSLRAGLATSAYARGASEREIQAHGRWKDRRSLDRYIHLNAVPGRKNLVTVVS
jgi:integrase